jgi:hypothetical protein
VKHSKPVRSVKPQQLQNVQTKPKHLAVQGVDVMMPVKHLQLKRQLQVKPYKNLLLQQLKLR